MSNTILNDRAIKILEAILLIEKGEMGFNELIDTDNVYSRHHIPSHIIRVFTYHICDDLIKLSRNILGESHWISRELLWFSHCIDVHRAWNVDKTYTVRDSMSVFAPFKTYTEMINWARDLSGNILRYVSEAENVLARFIVEQTIFIFDSVILSNYPYTVTASNAFNHIILCKVQKKLYEEWGMMDANDGRLRNIATFRLEYNRQFVALLWEYIEHLEKLAHVIQLYGLQIDKIIKRELRDWEDVLFD